MSDKRWFAHLDLLDRKLSGLLYRLRPGYLELFIAPFAVIHNSVLSAVVLLVVVLHFLVSLNCNLSGQTDPPVTLKLAGAINYSFHALTVLVLTTTSKRIFKRDRPMNPSADSP